LLSAPALDALARSRVEQPDADFEEIKAAVENGDFGLRGLRRHGLGDNRGEPAPPPPGCWTEEWA